MAVMVNDRKDSRHFIAYKTGKPLARFSVLRSYLILPFSRKTAGHFFRFVGGVITNFFLIQQKQKIGITHIPVVHVDHPLDEKIAFTPGKVKIYLDFVGFFIRIFSMLLKRLGLKTGLKYCADFFDFLTRLYKNAGSVYSQCLTTTDRPHYKKNLRFLVIHLFDPHLLCVPSLHVAIVVLTFSFFKTIFERANFTQEEKKNWNEELYSGALAITESVLFVKQHSVNCVSAAMYMMTKITPFITAQEAQDFISHIFENSPEIDQEKRIEIVNHIMNMFNQFSQESKQTDKWEVPIQNWLTEHSQKTNQA